MHSRLNLPNGELNVVKKLDSSSSSTFQYPHLASRMEGTVLH